MSAASTIDSETVAKQRRCMRSASMPFRAILKTLVTSQPAHVRGVVFCDELGERVERWAHDGEIDPFELDVAGASFAPIAAQIVPTLAPSHTHTSMRMVVDDGVVWLGTLASGYYVVVLGRRAPGDVVIVRALADALGAIEANM